MNVHVFTDQELEDFATKIAIRSIELFKASQETDAERDMKRPVNVRELAKEKGIHPNTLLNKLKARKIPTIKDNPKVIEFRYVQELLTA